MEEFLNSFFALVIFCSCSQKENKHVPLESNVVIEKVCDLPDEVHETSGIIFFKDLLWTINDSGNEPELYAVDTNTGKLKHIIQLLNTENIDWEAITQDDENIYIADNGNNTRTRPDYQLYIINKDSISEAYKQSINVDKITYKFREEDLEGIGLSSELVNSEAIIVKGNKFYVYIKDFNFENLWVFSFYLDTTEIQVGELGGHYTSGYAITAATLVNDNYIALLGYKDYHSYFTVLEADPDLLNAPKEKCSFELEKLVGNQTEGITYINGKYYISSEASNITQALFRMQLYDNYVR